MESIPSKVYELNLHGKKLSQLDGVNKFQHLRSLDASCNKLSRIHDLEHNKELRELKLYGNEITVIEGLKKLRELCVLLLQHNRIASVGGGLVHLKKLRQLRLDHNRLTKITQSDLTSCGSHMTHLDLSHNHLTSVQGLGSLGELEELKLASNRLSCPPDLSRCRKLTELDLSDNPLTVESLSPSLKQLTQLKILHLDKTQLCDISHLPKLVSLDTLHLCSNGLATLNGLTRLYPALEVLDVRWNNLSLEAVRELEGLVGLSETLLEGNPLCGDWDYRRDVHNSVQSLEIIDGVTVSLLTFNLRPSLEMRPLTPSSLGPTLCQMEQQVLGVELQLDRIQGEMATQFELTRAKMEATMRESEEKIVRSLNGNEQVLNGNSSFHDANSASGETHFQSTETKIKTESQDQQSQSRPSTRCGSRARLSEALALATLYQDQVT